MSKFTEILIYSMLEFEHTTKQMSEALDISEETLKEILDGKEVPEKAVISEMCDIYHIEAKEQRNIEKAWVQAKKDHNDMLRRLDRQTSALEYLRTHIDTASLAEKRCCILAFAQYLHNTYIDINTPIYEKIMKMRSVYVYDLGGVASTAADSEIISSEGFWQQIVSEEKRIL